MVGCGILSFIFIIFVPALTLGHTGYYNYYDEVAQSICTAASSRQGWVFALRRDCLGTAPTCYNICQSARADMEEAISYNGRGSECFDAVNIAKNRPSLRPNPGDRETDAGKVGLVTYRYHQGGCSWAPNHCGPNYCCCRIPY
ncbi:Hypp7778 [Branchiostoma lanceolatum]|uniref:Hypp7778 protein n=1 Tax=Branchiostoma lanceolatum TaxID=7740 RepID=A0A8J9Z345_BRALA|nr:Hypp7778 [Branchiostoma lanceolatum]